MNTGTIKHWIKEPLLHFLLAGGLLFVAYSWINSGESESEAQVVRITAAEVNWLKETWSRRWSRQPDKQELRGLVAGHLKEKLLAQGARDLGLELDDTVVRRRLAQKMEFLVNDTASVMEPEEAELRQLYETDKERYQLPARLTFNQIYFKEQEAAQRALETIETEDPADLGDSSLLARDYTDEDEQALASMFGPEFAGKVFGLEKSGWQGPVASSYGFHLVNINEHKKGQALPFVKVRGAVEEEWRRIQQETLQEQYYASLLEKYDVVVEEEVGAILGPLTEALR